MNEFLSAIFFAILIVSVVMVVVGIIGLAGTWLIPTREKDMNEKLIAALKADEDFREGWRANIVMAIYDTRREPGESLHNWRNRCAETFLNRLCGQPEGLDDFAWNVRSCGFSGPPGHSTSPPGQGKWINDRQSKNWKRSLRGRM